MARLTPAQRMADALLAGHGTTLEQFIRDRRTQTPPVAWERLARDLHELSGGAIDVTSNTVRNWAATYDLHSTAA